MAHSAGMSALRAALMLTKSHASPTTRTRLTTPTAARRRGRAHHRRSKAGRSHTAKYCVSARRVRRPIRVRHSPICVQAHCAVDHERVNVPR